MFALRGENISFFFLFPPPPPPCFFSFRSELTCRPADDLLVSLTTKLKNYFSIKLRENFKRFFTTRDSKKRRRRPLKFYKNYILYYIIFIIPN